MIHNRIKALPAPLTSQVFAATHARSSCAVKYQAAAAVVLNKTCGQVEHHCNRVEQRRCSGWPAAMKAIKVAVTPDPGSRSLRLLCLVTCYRKEHCTSAQAMRITCLKRCTQVRFMSDLDDPTTLPGSVAMPHQGPEHYNNLWGKTRSILVS